MILTKTSNMLLKIHPKNPEPGKIQLAVESLDKGGVIIYPTDSVYALGCDLMNKNAIDRIIKIRGDKVRKFEMTFICSDISMVSDYILPMDTSTFRIIKKNTPGPFTFILEANNKVGKLIEKSKKTVGIRIPENPVALEIVKELGRPILSISLKIDDNEENEIAYISEPEDIYDRFKNDVDMVIDAGVGSLDPSTVVDVADDFSIIRQGAAELIL